MIRYLLLSDIHLGHNRTNAEYITNNLKSFFKKYKRKLKNIDMIIISGDVFDRLLPINSPDSLISYNWLTELIKYCANNNLKLRILEGTPSHDWKQVKLIYKIVNEFNLDLDFKYYNDIDIEIMTINGYELSVLYIPDEIYDNSEKIWEAVLNKLNEYDLDKIDLIVMHGAFKYQLPIKNLDFLHDENRYLSIVNYLINIGHVHNHSEFSKILCPGSFDRLTFSDENDNKGGWLITLKENGNVNKEFLENSTAMIFKTINLTKEQKQIDKILKVIPDYSNIRLLIDKDDSIKNLINELQFKYPNKRFIIKDKNKKDVKNITTTKNNKRELFKFKINKDNIKELILEELNEKDENVIEEIDYLISN